MLDAGDDTGFWAASSGGSGTKQGSPGLGAAICGTQPSVTTGEGRRGELTRLAAVSGRLAAGGRRGALGAGQGWMNDGWPWMGQDQKFQRQLSNAEGEKRMALLSLFFLPVTEYGEMGETEEEVADVQQSGAVVCAKTQAAQTHPPMLTR